MAKTQAKTSPKGKKKVVAKAKPEAKAKARPAAAKAKKGPAKRGRAKKTREPGQLSRQAMWQRKHKEAGLCVLCSEPSFKGWRCVKHYEKHKTMMRERYQPTVRGRYNMDKETNSSAARRAALAEGKKVGKKAQATAAKPKATKAKTAKPKVKAKIAKPPKPRAPRAKKETPASAEDAA